MPESSSLQSASNRPIQLGSGPKRQGGTLIIEIGLLVVIVGLAAATVFWVFGGSATQSVNWGLNGVVETRCVNGFRFIIGQNGSAQQILDQQGGGVRCTEGPASKAAQSADKHLLIPTN